MSRHTCHALRCDAPCPPRHLMCRRHWAMVPPELQADVNVTVRQRGDFVGPSWAPWWRAQARAVAAVAHREQPNESARDAYIARADAFAEQLERRQP